MAILEMTFVLSAPARRALEKIPSAHSLEFIAERFFDKLEHERYRSFAVEPRYFTCAHGYRRARQAEQRPRGEKLHSHRLRLTIRTFRAMKRLQAKGLSLSWQLEEMLFFAFQEGMIQFNADSEKTTATQQSRRDTGEWLCGADCQPGILLNTRELLPLAK